MERAGDFVMRGDDPADRLAAATLARLWPACFKIPGVDDDEIMGHAMNPSFWVQALRSIGCTGAPL